MHRQLRGVLRPEVKGSTLMMRLITRDWSKTWTGSRILFRATLQSSEGGGGGDLQQHGRDSCTAPVFRAVGPFFQMTGLKGRAGIRSESGA